MKNSVSADLTQILGPRPQYPVESVDNVLKILLLLRDQDELKQREVAKFLGVAESTAHRLLAMLHYRGFLRRDQPRGPYQPGPALTTLAYTVIHNFDVVKTLRPLLEHLHAEFSETVHLGTLDGTRVRFLDAIESPKPVRVASRLGSARSAKSTATGKALLAQMSQESIDALFESADALLPADFKTVLETVRFQGYATSNEDNEDGVASIAMAIPARSSPLSLAFNVSFPVNRIADNSQERIVQELHQTVTQAEELL